MSGRSSMHFGASLMTVDWVAQFSARLRAELGWTPRIVDLGGGLGVRHVLEEPAFTIDEFVGGAARRAPAGLAAARPAASRSSCSSRAARSFARRRHAVHVGGVKRASAATTYVTVDGGMSDNPRPAMYNARYTALLANRADEAADRRLRGRRQALRVGDVLIERVELPSRGAATCSRSRSPARTRSRWLELQRRPAAGRRARRRGEARLIRRRETVDDLLALET